MSSGVALIWDVSAPAQAAAELVAALGDWVPVVSPRVAVALHPGLAVVHLQFEGTVRSPAELSRMEAQTRLAGGRFIDLLHIPEKKREDFRRRYLTPPKGEALRFDSFAAAAQAVRGALEVPAVKLPEARGPPSRAARRYDVLLVVEFKTEADFIREHTTNISKGGLFIPTPLRPALNSQAHLTIGLPNGASLGTIVRVVHLLEHPTHGGVGVALLADAAFSAGLAEYLATLKA